MSQEHTDSNAEVESEHEQYLMPVSKNLTVLIKRALGWTVEDSKGNEYLDGVSGISDATPGHTNCAVLEAAGDVGTAGGGGDA